MKEKGRMELKRKDLLEFLRNPYNVLGDFNDIVTVYEDIGEFIADKVSEKIGRDVYSEINVNDLEFSGVILQLYTFFKFAGKERSVNLYTRIVIDWGKFAENEKEFDKKVREIVDKAVKEYNTVANFFKKIKKGLSLERMNIAKIHVTDVDGEVDETVYAILPRGMTGDKLQKIVDRIKEEMVDDNGVPYWSTDDIYEELEKEYKVKFIPVKHEVEIVI